MQWRGRAAIPGFLVLLTLAPSAGARDPSPSVVWYRASDQCPSGAEFIRRLPGGEARARLADAGDHIDFVVTLVAARDGTVGRLERQTQAGTVGIRDLRDASCEQVADALALSLGLALDPAQAPMPASTAEPLATAIVPARSAEDPTSAPAPRAESSAVGAGSSNPRAVPVAPPTASPVPAIRRPGASDRARWSLGLAGGVLLGVTPGALPRASAFIELQPALAGLASELALRLGLVGALGSPTTEVGPVRHWIAAGRAEACPWRWGGAKVGVRPCVDFELGAAGASDSRASGQSGSDVWAAPGLGLRAGFVLLPKFTLELGGDAQLPLVRSEVDAGSVRLYRTEFAALSGYVGASVAIF